MGIFGSSPIHTLKKVSTFLIRAEDPIFHLATPLQPEEDDSHTREAIAPSAGQDNNSADLWGPADATAVQGGWFGRGYNKGRRKKKKAA